MSTKKQTTKIILKHREENDDVDQRFSTRGKRTPGGT